MLIYGSQLVIGLFRFMVSQVLSECYTQARQVISTVEVESLKKEIRACRYLSSNQLSNSFSSTSGFSIVFKPSGRHRAEEKFPFLKPYFHRVIDELEGTYNIFYCNVLMIAPGGQVKMHVDSSLSPYLSARIVPNRVSVFYAQVPTDMSGGKLILEGGQHGRVAIQPEENLLVSFLGFLRHSVTEMTGAQSRISVVCEHYKLPETQLQRVPDFWIESEINRGSIEL